MFACLLVATAVAPLPPGDHVRKLTVDGRERECLVHVPVRKPGDPPPALALALHGAGMNGGMMSAFTELSAKADAAGFVVAYPDGTGNGPFKVWNSGGFGPRGVDDVKFLAAVLDDLASAAPHDRKRVYATGMSNGGMMCPRLAAELSERIAAVASVAGGLTIADPMPKRPVPILHLHGTGDTIVPFDMPIRPGGPGGGGARLRPIKEGLEVWRKLYGCPAKPTIVALPNPADDGMSAKRFDWAPGPGGGSVSLIEIRGHGHTWPGVRPPIGMIGRSTKDFHANDVIWEFFQRHRLP